MTARELTIPSSLLTGRLAIKRQDEANWPLQPCIISVVRAPSVCFFPPSGDEGVEREGEREGSLNLSACTIYSPLRLHNLFTSSAGRERAVPSPFMDFTVSLRRTRLRWLFVSPWAVKITGALTSIVSFLA